MKNKNFLLTAVILALFAGFFIGLGTNLREENVTNESIENVPQLSTEGFSKADVQVSPFIIYLTAGCYRLSMITNDVQTDSIGKAILNVSDMRPSTHDMINQIMMNFDIRPIMVKVESFRNETYYSKILLRRGNNVLNLDSRPSDSIAIAVRTETPIYVKNDLLEKMGEKIC